MSADACIGSPGPSGGMGGEAVVAYSSRDELLRQLRRTARSSVYQHSDDISGN